MTPPHSAADILQDIQFEILQGLVDKDDLAPALHAVQQFQNQARRQAFERVKLTDTQREIFSRQFQFMDMLLNLLEALALRLQAVQAEVAGLRRAPEGMLRPGEQISPTGGQPSLETAAPAAAVSASLPLPLDNFPASLPFRPADEIEYAIRPETIHVDLQARPFRIPIIGWLLTRLRIFYQRPALFYTQLLVNRQAPVNRVLGDRILYLEGLIAAQQQQIQALQVALNSDALDAEG